jgi:hypothetical protein
MLQEIAHRYPVLERARLITEDPELDILEIRRHLGVPLAADMKQWLGDQPPRKLVSFDFAGIRAVTLSVAEEIGPLLMQEIAQRNALDQRYPAFQLKSPEPAYTFARAFSNIGTSAIGIVDGTDEPTTAMTAVAVKDSKCGTVVVLGQLTKQMEQILRFADLRAQASEPLTSEDLINLDFLANVSPAARSKRLTELYSRRLLAFEENPRNAKERLFTPVWRLPTQ